MEKLDIHNTASVLETTLRSFNADEKISKKQKEDILRFIELCKIGKLGKKTGNHKLISYISNLRKLYHHFKKELDALTEAELEKFYNDLQTDKIKRNDGKPYKPSSKNEMIKPLKKYLRWKLNDEIKYKKLIGWMKEEKQIPEIPAISIEDLEKLSKAAENPRDQALIMFLGDSGCRIEEALNLKINQIEKKKKEKGKGYYYLVDVKISKTLPRRISVPLATKYVTNWLKVHPDRTNLEAYLFPITYDGARMMVKRLSKKVIGRQITPHILRHSSASYYCKKINNPFLFVYRYGWAINSNHARRYIDRNLLGEEEQEKLTNVIDNDKMQEMEERLKSLEESWQRIAIEKHELIADNKTLKNHRDLDFKEEFER